ncbi:MAG: hypothetical protein OHK93_003664 [Ramalina farinacea]|uniref:Uncharacterized protein n=1 Tax=Ramalina farinacea TaxID=258253 RepID=A0AA43U030_9LECA|nr:hypothetical protein [Ramalina farinacea]
MPTVTSPKSDSSRPSLEIHVPLNVYPLEHPKTQHGIALLQQLIDLAAAVGDSLDRIQSDLPSSNCCTCILRNLQEPVNRYSHSLAERYELDQIRRDVPANLTDTAVFASIKAKMNRELRKHVALIEASLRYYGEGLDIGRLFSADVDLLIRIGVDVEHLMRLVLDAYDRPELKSKVIANLLQTKISYLQNPTESHIQWLDKLALRAILGESCTEQFSLPKPSDSLLTKYRPPSAYTDPQYTLTRNATTSVLPKRSSITITTNPLHPRHLPPPSTNTKYSTQARLYLSKYHALHTLSRTLLTTASTTLDKYLHNGCLCFIHPDLLTCHSLIAQLDALSAETHAHAHEIGARSFIESERLERLRRRDDKLLERRNEMSWELIARQCQLDAQGAGYGGAGGVDDVSFAARARTPSRAETGTEELADAGEVGKQLGEGGSREEAGGVLGRV